jgi:ABC-type multidrug transport system permease subunit
MRFMWSTAVKDWRRHRRDPVGIFMWIGIPLLIGGLLTAISGGRGGPRPQAHVLVADADSSLVSRLLIGSLGQAGGIIRAETVGQEVGRKRIADGDATALLLVPKGFGTAVLQEKPAQLELLTNPSQTILPKIVEETLGIFIDGTFYLHRLVGEDLRQLAAGPPDGAAFPDQQVAQFSAKINQLVNRLRGYLFPPVITIETVKTEDPEEDDTPKSPALIFLPGILFMSLLFMAQGLSIDLWREREEKTLRRVTVSPQSLFGFLLGKVVSGVGVMFLVILIALAVGYAFFGVPVSSFPLAIVWSLVSGAFLMQMMTIIQVHSPSERAGEVFTMVLIFPLMMIGGSFFPFEAMPAGMAAIGRLTPNGWALAQLQRIIHGKVETGALMVSFAGLLVVGSVLFFISARRIRGAFARS